MKTNEIMGATQARINDFLQQLAEDPILGTLASPADVQHYLQAGFSALFNAVLLRERALFLERHPEDRANGFAPSRELQVKTVPIMVERPRTRGNFYPAFLPRYQHHIPEDYQELLEHILLNAKSFDAALRTMQSLGLGYSRKELETLLRELEREAEAFHQRPLSPDWLVLYIDAKELDLKDEHEQVKKAIHFMVIGVNFDARKEVLCAKSYWGNETIESWRQLFTELKNRGLTRVLLIVTDDFSGLKSLVRSFWPQSDHQLCCVHLLRNARRQLAPEDYAAFYNAWQEIIASSSFETAREKWLALLEKLRANYPAWAAYLQPRTEHYLRFMHYPRMLQRSLRSTNLPEGINNLIETIRRSAGGHFHTQRELTIKMKIMSDQLARRKWAKPHPMIAYHRATLIHMFKQRFEAELPKDYFLTQNY